MSMASVDVQSRPAAHMPSLYIQTGLLFLIGAAALVVMQLPGVMAPPRHNPVTLVLTHLVVLGFGTLITFGALNQMIPVILGERIDVERHTKSAYAHFVPGLLLQVMGFASWTPWLIAVGGSLVVTGTLIFTVPYMPPLFKRVREDHTALFILAALVYVDLTVLFGVLMAIQLQTVYSSWLFDHGLVLHLLLGGLGWFTGIIIGVSYKLFPMFTTTKSVPVENVRRIFLLFQTGLLVAVVMGMAGSTDGMVAGLLVVAGSLGLYIIDVRRMLKSRLRRNMGPGMQQSAIAVVHLVGSSLAAALLFLAALNHWFAPTTVLRLSVAVGVWFAFGWVGSMILGMLSKIAPMLVWLDRYSERAGESDTPTIAQLIDDRGVRAGGIGYQIGLGLLVVAVSLGNTPLGTLGASVFLFGTLYLTATFFHVWYPQK